MSCDTDTEGRILNIVIKIDGQTLRLLNVYAPNTDSPEFYAKIVAELQSCGEDHVVFGGDMNIVMDVNKDKKGGRRTQTKSAEILKELTAENEWFDAWRMLNGDKFQFTWKGGTPLVMTRLDYLFVPLGTLLAVENCEILPAIISDHCPVVMKLRTDYTLKGPGYWKLNVSLLRNKELIDQVNEAIDRAKLRFQLLNPANKWEKMKLEIKSVMITYAREQAAKHRDRLKMLQHKLGMLNKKLAMVNLSSDSAVKIIQDTNCKIEKIQQEIAREAKVEIQGAILRAKARWYSQSEHSTKYFFNLEKRNAKNKVMSATYDKNGAIVTNQGTILRLQSEFYAKLYTADENFECKINGEPEKRVPVEMRNDLEAKLSMDELQQAIKTMARNKSPGLSGLPIDPYIVFWTRLKEILFEAYQFALNQGRLHDTARLGLISLIPKRDRNLLYIKNWRPIILLESDFKILAKVLANRIKLTLDHIIGREQTAFIKGRQISENLRKLMDIIIHMEDENKPGYLILLDFEKAFDKIEYRAVDEVLKWFNFSDEIRDWVKVIFQDFELAVYNNGYISDSFKAKKGLFQGNPVAPYLSIVVMELLATKIRQNAKIKGLKMGDAELLLAMFADDLGLVLDPSQECWNETVNELNNFQNSTGMVINYDKTVVYRLGSARHTNARFYSNLKLIWSDEPVVVLGVTITDNVNELLELNYIPVIKKAEGILRVWEQRDLSLFGKILLINSLVASLFVYKFAVLPKMPNDYHVQLESLFRRFIWKGKAKISLDIIQGLKSDGGAGLVNLRKKDVAMKLQWVVNSRKSEVIKACADVMLGNTIGEQIWEAQLKEKHCKLLIQSSNFWTEIFKDWCKLSYLPPKDAVGVRQQSLWYNSGICMKGSPVINAKWSKAGINHIKDICHENGEFLSFEEFKEKFGHVNFTGDYLFFNGIVAAIPKEWKRWLKTKEETDWVHLYCEIKDMNKVSRVLYHKLLQNDDLLNRKVIKFNRLFDTNMDNELFRNYVLRINKFTICVKLRSFQYRLIMSAIVTNIHLKHYGILDSNSCTFCNNEVETCIHLFYDCVKVKPIWIHIKKEFKLTFEVSDLILNNIVDNPKHMENCIVLIAKYYIYKTRCLKEQISVMSCTNYIKNYIAIEEQIAKENNKLGLHTIKWSNAEKFIE